MKKQLIYIMALTVIMDISLLYTRNDRLQTTNQIKFKTDQTRDFKSANQLYSFKNKSKFKNQLKNSRRKKSLLKKPNKYTESSFGNQKDF